MVPTASINVLNIAHRGARAYAPENTLVAFAKAKALGCDMFEMDVRLAKDGIVVVYHDDDLVRCTDAKTKFPGRSRYDVADFTHSELSRLDAGSWYIAQLKLSREERLPFLQTLSDGEIADFVSVSEREHYASGNIKIPTLTETLSLAKELNLKVNIELKSHPDGHPGLVEAVLKDVQTTQLADQVLISSFDHALLQQVRQQTSRIAIAVLTEGPIKAPVAYLRTLKANAYNIGCHKDYKRHGFGGLSGKRYLTHIDEVRNAGFDVNVWTCNDPQEMVDLLAAGVTGLISDYPNRVGDAIKSFAQGTC
ncbi:glycerophosphoryl diester phosphodiesterase [Methyloglobulus morosus KoM1]|uniref:Glycerophosphoryl diester phosphodiesterase n=2 Tax=Methyloglobulus TaxID=1410680 RepID=V5DVY0_9GAMM|nr:glycerophosphoryl diester phosphodiesterase [Methyloglobulus morosus KoM1]